MFEIACTRVRYRGFWLKVFYMREITITSFSLTAYYLARRTRDSFNQNPLYLTLVRLISDT
jgi:hypothetical protein